LLQAIPKLTLRAQTVEKNSERRRTDINEFFLNFLRIIVDIHDDSLNRFSSASPGFILKNHLNDRSKIFML